MRAGLKRREPGMRRAVKGHCRHPLNACLDRDRLCWTINQVLEGHKDGHDTWGTSGGERPVLRKQIHTVSAGNGYECPGMEQELPSSGRGRPGPAKEEQSEQS